MPHTGNRRDDRVAYSCSECGDFELEKAYSGATGTKGEEDYAQIEPPEGCPACGADVETQSPPG